MIKRATVLVAVFAVACIAANASSVTVFVNSTGAIQHSDKTADFEGLNVGPYSTLSQGGITFTDVVSAMVVVADPGNALHTGNLTKHLYLNGGNGGTGNPLQVQAVGGPTMYGFQFLFGSGFNGTTQGQDLYWEALLGGNPVDQGGFAVAPGSTIGLRSTSGFDTVLLWNCSNTPNVGCTGNGFSGNALAMDNVVLDITAPVATVPEPSSFMLLGCSALALARKIHRMKK